MSAKRCFSCSASVRPARPPPMMTTSWRDGGRAGSDRRRLQRVMRPPRESGCKCSARSDQAASAPAAARSRRHRAGAATRALRTAAARRPSRCRRALRAAVERIGAARGRAARERPVERRHACARCARGESTSAHGEQAACSSVTDASAPTAGDVVADQQHRPLRRPRTAPRLRAGRRRSCAS